MIPGRTSAATSASWYRRVGAGCAAAAAAAAGVGLVQWFSSPGLPADIQRGYVPMAPTTGLATFVISASVLARLRVVSWRRAQMAVDVACLAVLALAGLVLWARVGGQILGLERWLAPAATETAKVPPGVMSPVTAVLFMLSSLSLLLARPAASAGRLRHWAAVATAVVVAASGLIVVTGYAYGTPFLYGLGLIPVALITGLAFLLNGMSLWVLPPDDRWPMVALLRPSVRSRLLLVFVPLVLVLVLAGGAVQLRLLPRLANPAAGALLLALVTGLLAAVVVFLLAARIGDRADGLVRGHELEARDAKAFSAELERRVDARTLELRRMVTDLESFSYSIAHDLRAPLRAINGYATILQDDYADSLDDEGRRLLRRAAQAAVRMGMLIDDLLDFSRAGTARMDRVDVDMCALVQVAFEDVVSDPDRSRIIFEVDGLPHAVGDPSLLRQVWVNLLGNAVKFSAGCECPRLQVGCDEDGREQVYRVADSGIGFDMAFVDKVFGMFESAHTPGVFEGTGVGLAIAQRIVERHGGRMWVRSKEGQGATFYFSLPKVLPSDAAGDGLSGAARQVLHHRDDREPTLD